MHTSFRQVGGAHYTVLAVQPWDIIDGNLLGFYEGNVIKYLLRSKNRLEDLKKARHYLDRMIETEKQRPISVFFHSRFRRLWVGFKATGHTAKYIAAKNKLSRTEERVLDALLSRKRDLFQARVHISQLITLEESKDAKEKERIRRGTNGWA